MSEQIFMDVDKTRDRANVFGQVSEVLEGVSTALQAIITALMAASFFSFGTTEPLRQTLENIKRVIDEVSQKCSMLKEALSKAAQAFEEGNAQGAALFISNAIGNR